MDIKKRIYFLSFLSLLLFAPLFSAVQAETTYTIYESELNRLEQNLETLDRNNKSNQKLLAKQKEQLEQAEKELKIANDLIKKSQIQNEQTQKSLQNAEISLKQYEQEAERKIRIKTRQRNLWIAVSIGLGILAMK